ncbi:RagB/SusD family nutrient uptake outer membrane protein [Gelidibacter salicanalis]|uniref:RagB/SusD family nutrient uptake outer membrane protein n=1 Tax=Gelidibacter salicanalis TaxID=291193 RepID=A0A934KTV1_9FLAO|nr:RagB/SusD family nutrient uptake outer membrane protein [Gelidibacter salicanalis]MBJ7880653.1 RagB/SusD family nutrient uptake outer membrane protein [Gelidibacter salicanalis]
MKNFKFILILIFGFLSSSCNLDEDPIFLDETLYDTPQSASAALDGIYQELTNYNTLERRIFVVNGFSGLFVAARGGDNINSSHNSQIVSLKPTYDGDSESMWGGLYGAIAQTNSAIKSITVVDNPSTKDELLFSDIAGHAYFVRAWSYFSLVRLFGDIPLWLELADSENLNKSKSTAKEVYAQVISDAKNAASLLNGASGNGYPKRYAANMLLAKVYMTLATNPDLREGSLTEMDYWQMAYTEAMKVYGIYTLVPNYSSLFTDSNENSTESIFELQISQDAANSQMGRNFTPPNYKASQAYGYLRVHADVYDQHVNTYPGDPRIDATYLSEYANANTGDIIKVYPADATRANFKIANPYFFKFAEKDKTHSNQFNNQNHIIYRYGELLIMLAEISNELQNGQQLGYVTELLDRVGKVPHAGYLGSKENFRDAIMMEYRFELIGEGEDSHNNRRRGFDYFLKNTINKHNNNPGFNANVDLTLNTTKSEVMGLPIPLKEVNTNELIN